MNIIELIVDLLTVIADSAVSNIMLLVDDVIELIVRFVRWLKKR